MRQNLLDHLPQDPPAVVALDDTRIRKSWPQGQRRQVYARSLGPLQVNLIWAQRFLQLSMASAADGQARMVPIGWRHAPHPPKPTKNSSEQERQRYREDSHKQSLGVVAGNEMARLRSWRRTTPAGPKTAVDDRRWRLHQPYRAQESAFPHDQRVASVRDAKLYFLPESTTSRQAPGLWRTGSEPSSCVPTSPSW
ncbi:MAG: hypothetical protein U5J83_02090 [Bryobacterales bacterium]|nr:hypothetical protein [Bryobacterales bacterium]